MTEEPEVKREGTITLECSVKTLREFLAPLVALQNEAKLTVLPDGISTVVVDPAHICMVSLKLGNSAFKNHISICGNVEAFAFDTERVLIFLRNLEPFTKEIKVTLSAKEGNSDRLSITNENGDFHWSIDCINPGEISYPKIPNLDLKNLGPFPVKRLLDGLKLMSAITDHLRIINDRDFRFGVWFDCEDSDGREALSWKVSGENEFMRSDKIRAIYPMEYLTELLRSLPEGNVDMLLGTDYPLRLEFSFGEGYGEGTYYLAPRIESGD